MNKRKIMTGAFTVNLLILLSFFVLKFIYYPSEQVEADMIHVTAAYEDNMTSDEYIKVVKNLAEYLNDDIMIRFVNLDYSMDYYRTTSNPDFISLSGMDDLNSVYSTHPDTGEKKIKGFFLKDNKFRIIPVSSLAQTDKDLSACEFILRNDCIQQFTDYLSSCGFEISSEAGVSIEDDFSSLYLLICIFNIFLVISAVFYSFSRAKEFVVRKTLGYGKKDIIISELKKNIPLFVCISAAVIVIFGIIFSVIFDISSVLLFIRKYALYFMAYIVAFFSLLALAVCIVTLRCSVLDVKGRSLNRDLFFVTALFKTVMILFLAVTMTDLGEAELNMIRSLRQAEQASEIAKGYAATSINVLIEDPDNEPEKYAPVFLDFYNQLKAERRVVIAEFSDAANQETNHTEDGHEHVNPIEMPRVIINDIYLDVNDTVFDMNGNRIDSSVLEKDKFNFLVPDGFDTAPLEMIYTRSGAFKSDDLNYIYYSADSTKFFTYSNNIQGLKGCFAENVIAVVYNPDFDYRYQDARTFSYFIGSYISGSCFFEYDTESDEDALEQILPVLRNTGTDKIIISTPDISDVFLEWINVYRNQCVFEGIQFVITLVSFLILLVYTTELYYRNYSKEISLKQINGFTFTGMFGYRMIFKMMIIPLMIFSGSVNIYVALFCSAAEILIFTVCMNKNMNKNISIVLKGE